MSTVDENAAGTPVADTPVSDTTIGDTPAPGDSGTETHARDAAPPAHVENGPGPARRWWPRRRAGRRTGRRPWRRTAATACVAALTLAGAGLFGSGLAARDPAASGNRALTDAAATDRVTGDVSSALSRIFAYTPDGTQATAQAADQVLGGTAAEQYRRLFARIRGEVAAQRLTLTTRVVRAGVVSLSADRARLLVFLDQSAQRAGGPVTGAAAQLSVTARLEGGHWRITELRAR